MPQPRLQSKSRRPLWLFGTLWSFREYPTRKREWSLARKLSEIQRLGCDGVFAPPRPELAERGALRYLAVTSLEEPSRVDAVLMEAAGLGALAIDIQLGRPTTSLREAVRLALRIRDVARELSLPFAIETHRATVTETPESTLALMKAYRKAAGDRLPLCLDQSHFAVVRHLCAPFWAELSEPRSLLKAAAQLHLRPFNGHHCQLPVLTPSGRRTPEYRDWLAYARCLLEALRSGPGDDPILAVPELGHGGPPYRLSGFPDTRTDLGVLVGDLRR